MVARIARAHGTPEEALERLNRGYLLLKGAVENLGSVPAGVATGKVDFSHDYVTAQIARYTEILELHYQHYMAMEQPDKAVQIMMVLLKYHVQLFGGAPRIKDAQVQAVEMAQADEQAREMSDEELEEALRS
jgi:hypothetical protein